jgi:hypothetical protein
MLGGDFEYWRPGGDPNVVVNSNNLLADRYVREKGISAAAAAAAVACGQVSLPENEDLVAAVIESDGEDGWKLKSVQPIKDGKLENGAKGCNDLLVEAAMISPGEKFARRYW